MFPLALTAEALYDRKSVDVSVFEEDRSFEPKFQVEGTAPINVVIL